MEKHIKRTRYLNDIEQAFKSHSIVALLGPRQSGKTTLSKDYAQSFQTVHSFDLEDSRDAIALQNPLLMLGGLRGLIIIDEIQRVPNLFTALRLLVDQKKIKNF